MGNTTGKSNVFYAIGMFLLAYAILYVSLPLRVIATIFNSMFVGVGFSVLCLYWPLTRQILLGRGEYKRAQQMALALVLLWAAILLDRSFATSAMFIYPPRDMLHLNIEAFVSYIGTVSGCLHMTAPGLNDKYMHRQSTTQTCIALAAGAALGGLLLWLRYGFTFWGL
jgi:hypothetical protein